MDAWRATSDAKYGVGRWCSLTIRIRISIFVDILNYESHQN